MRDSGAAAQALQGPLDGTWALWDGHRQPRYVFQITDPAGGAGPPEGAWRRFGAAATGPIAAIIRRGDRLTIQFAADGEVVRVSLSRHGDGEWSGDVKENGRDLSVAVRLSGPRWCGARHRC